MPLEGFTRPFAAYAVVSASVNELDIDIDCYAPALAVELASVVEQSINYYYHVEPPLCGSCHPDWRPSLLGPLSPKGE